jgi:hypothetical protein
MKATYMIPGPSILFVAILIAVFVLTFRAVKKNQDEPRQHKTFRKVFHGLLTFLQAFLTTVFLGGLAAGLGLLILKSPLREALVKHREHVMPLQPTEIAPGGDMKTMGELNSLEGPQFQGILRQLESVERQLDDQLRAIQVNPQGVSENVRGSIGELKSRLEADRLRIQTMIKEQSKTVQEQILREEIEKAQARVTEQARRLEELEKEVEKSRRVTEHMEQRAWEKTRPTELSQIDPLTEPTPGVKPGAEVPTGPAMDNTPAQNSEPQEEGGQNEPGTPSETPQENSQEQAEPTP